MFGGDPRGTEPNIEGAYLLAALFEAGPTEWRDGIEQALSWPVLWYYARATGEITEPWEFRAVMAMSRAYVQGKRDGTNIHSIPPAERDL